MALAIETIASPSRGAADRIVEQVSAVLDEALKETAGTSSKKWALVLVAFVVGATAAFWLVRRSRSAGTALHPVVPDTP